MRGSEIVNSTEGRNGADGDKVHVNRDVAEGPNAERLPSNRR